MKHKDVLSLPPTLADMDGKSWNVLVSFFITERKGRTSTVAKLANPQPAITNTPYGHPIKLPAYGLGK